MPSGDPRDDFTEYVVARRVGLVRTAYLLTGNIHDAEDLVQATLIKAAAAWERVTGDPDPYLRRIMINQNISRWRRRRWRELPGAIPDVPAATPDTDTALELQHALGELTPKQRAVIVLRYFEGLSEMEIADTLGVSAGTVKSQAHAAIRRLRDLVPEIDPSNPSRHAEDLVT